MTMFLVALAALATFFAAIVAGFENGVYSLSQIGLRYRLSIGDRRAGVVEKLLANPQQLLTGVLILQSVLIYITTAIATSLLESWGVAWAEIASTVALAVFFFIAVEAVPKSVFRRAADTLVYSLAGPMRIVLYALRPAEAALSAVTSLIRRIGAGRADVFDPFFTRERLAYYLREGQTEGVLSRYQIELTHNILRGEKATVGRAMVPIDKAAVIPVGATREDFVALSRQYRFSRYPVYEGSRDCIVGILNIYDCLTPALCEFSVEKLMRPAAFFAPDVHVTEALRSMRETRQPMGVVADKGRAIGIVTMKDCMEEIVGELYAW
jgi:putative hemolysin